MQKKLNKIAKDTNIFLEKFIKKQKKSELIIPMRYGLFSGGKKIRSKILIDIGSLLSIDYKTLITIGSAVECIHAYTLIHDDLPCMDDDKIRRGKPSTHIKFGESTAILAGNSLQTIACEILASTNLKISEKIKVNLIKKLETESGINANTLNVSDFVKKINVIDALILHDKNDKVIPIDRSLNVHNNWPQSKFEEIEGTGHFRILRTDNVLDKVIEFIS